MWQVIYQATQNYSRQFVRLNFDFHEWNLSWLSQNPLDKPVLQRIYIISGGETFFDTSECKAPESRSKTTGRREPLLVHKVALTQNGTNFCEPNPDLLGSTANLGVWLPAKWVLLRRQTQCFAFGSVGAQTVS